MPPHVAPFFHPPTSTWSYIVRDPRGDAAAVIDPVLDFDIASGRVSAESAVKLLEHLREHALEPKWILETHAHADHLSAAAWLKRHTGAQVAIGANVVEVQRTFKPLLGLGEEFVADGSQFDVLLADGDALPLGELEIQAIATPGHTPDGLSYHIDDAVFVGDTLFAPALGSARCDFPGGDAATLFRSVQRLYALPDETRVFFCHDYPKQGEPPRAQSTIGEQQRDNTHVTRDATEAQFVAMRHARDATLAVPKLLWPALQVNIRAGSLPPADASGRRYLKLPLDAAGLD
ncbi:MAG TPA: MBL fold metallo-hydrolase [Rhodanobacteraceae bacterium]|nr:MBL fold metallo-hydrolase [Rhodanobacteraceae bacterium]